MLYTMTMIYRAAPGRRLAFTAATLLLVVLAGANSGFPLRAQPQIISEVTPGATPKPTPTPERRKPKPKPPAPTFSLLWKTLIHTSDGSPALAEGTAYVTAGGQVQQIDSGGHTLYATEIGTSQTTPAVDEARLYVGTDRGTVYGLNRKNGKVLWKWVGAANPVLTTPAFGAGRVYVESSDNNIYGLAAATGGRIWTFTRPDGSLGYSGTVFLRGDDPALAAPKSAAASDALFVCGDTTAYRVDPATGKEVWHAFVGGKSLNTPAIENGKLFVAGDGSGITALSAADGHPLWNFPGKAEKDWFGAPISGEGAVYATTRERWAYAVDTAKGKQKWSYRLPGSALSAPALDSKGHLLYLTCLSLNETPTLIALDSRTGVKKWETKAAGYISGSPAVNEAGTRVYVAGTANGYLYCFGTK